MKPLYLFVYGSLKPGECNDHMLRDWVTDSVAAWTPGEMRLRPDHYPALFLQDHGKIGTSNYSNDLHLSEAPICKGASRVLGKLLTLSEGLTALPELDDFEGFFPDKESEYLRVGLTVHTDAGLRTCWTYTGVGSPPGDWSVIEEWPPPRGVKIPKPYDHGIEGA